MNRAARALQFALAVVLGGPCLPAGAADPLPKFTLAVSQRYLGSALVLISAQKGYFRQAGVEVQLQSHDTGAAALAALLNGDADLATVGDMPLVYTTMAAKPVLVIATISVSSEDQGIVARRSRGIRSGADLKGKRVGTIPGTNGHYALDAMLVSNRVRPSDVQVVPLKPEELSAALSTNKVDAVATFEPYLSQAAAALGADAVTLMAGAKLYSNMFNLIVRAGSAQLRKDDFIRALRALVAAEHFARNDPKGAQAIVAAATAVSAIDVGRRWPKYNLGIRLEQALITLLESEANWAMRHEYVAPQSMPNFLNAIYVEPLLAVQPGAVSVIR